MNVLDKFGDLHAHPTRFSGQLLDKFLADRRAESMRGMRAGYGGSQAFGRPEDATRTLPGLFQPIRSSAVSGFIRISLSKGSGRAGFLYLGLVDSG